MSLINKYLAPLLKEYPFLQDIPLWVAAVLVGVGAVFYARIFVAFEHVSMKILSWGGLWLFLVSPLSLVIAWALVHYLAPGAEGSGIPQTMAAVNFKQNTSPGFAKLFSLRVMAVKVISSLLAVMGGGVVGREGPTIHLATGVFHFVSSKLSPPFRMADHRILIAAGGGAGLAAAFNTPLGGIVFTIEELLVEHLRKFRTSLFTSVIIAGILSQVFTGSYLFLGFPRVAPVKFSFIFVAIGIGLFTGAIGAWYGYLLRKFSVIRLRYFAGHRGAIWAALAGLILASAAYELGPWAVGSGHDMTRSLLFIDSNAPLWLGVVRILGSVVTYSCGVAGGIFAPAINSGAAIGAQIAGLLGDSQNANLMILLGMIGFLTGITRAPFTAFVLVVEMTDRHSAIFLMMTTALMAYGAARLVQKDPFYELAAEKYRKCDRSET